MADEQNSQAKIDGWIPTTDELDAVKDVYKCYNDGREVLEKSYNQFNGRTLQECIDDWEKRWNGYIPAGNPLLESQSMIFLNFTRNSIISYISKTGAQPSKAKIQAVNKKSGMMDKKFGRVCEDLVKYSQDEENGDARYQEINLERTIKGTAVVYEGYKRLKQKMKIPDGFDMETGKGKFKEENRTVFDNCFQKLVKVNHFLIKNPYLPAWRLQEQPFIVEEEITTFGEAKATYKKYKNFKYVQAGQANSVSIPTTFYENTLVTDLKKDQVQILKLFKRFENIHRIMINGVIVYDGPIPYKDGLYPYAVYIFEPFGNDFFWGAGFPNKIMGEQDGMNTDFNILRDKMINGALPTGISSDLDDLIDDEVIEMGKFRKVGDINKWKFLEYPTVQPAEAQFLQTTLAFARENSGDIQGLGNSATARGGKVTARQVLLKQQEAMQRMEFSMGYMEDGERDRTILRINHILQFYSIPKLEKITGEDGKVIEKMMYRDIKLSETQLSDGATGNKIIKLINSDTVNTPDQQQQLADQLSVTEASGAINGTPTEAVAVNVDMFYDHNLSIQVVKNSSFSRNQALDQAMKHEFADWIMSLIQFGLKVDVMKLAEWVGESYDAEVNEFISQQPQQPVMPGQQPGQLGQQGLPQPTAGGRSQAMGPKQMKQPALSQLMG